jgi:anti-sigma-K factor RskA
MNRHVNPEDSDLYALGALDGAEMQELEAHVRSCPECVRAIDEARQRVALLALAAPAVAPPARVKAALLRQVRAERVPETHRSGMTRPERTPRFGWLTPAFGVAAVVFAALAAGIWMKDARDNRRIHELEGQLALAETRSLEIARAADETDKLLGTPGTMRVALEQQAGWSEGRAGVLYNAKMGMVACSGWLPAAPAGKSYQLWLVPMEGKPVPLRVLSGGEWTEPFSAHVTPGMAAKAFAVTVEPKGGMPQPTGPKVLVGGVSQGE